MPLRPTMNPGSPDFDEARAGLVRFDRALQPTLLNGPAHDLHQRWGDALFHAGPEGPFVKLRRALEGVFATGTDGYVAFASLPGTTPLWRLEFTLTPERDTAGTVTSILAAALDRSRQLLREHALRESEDRLLLALRGAHDGWWDWNFQTQSIVYSRRWWEMLGYEENELPADSSLWRRLTHPDDLEKVEAAILAVTLRDNPYSEVEFRLKHKAGHFITVSSRAYLSRDAAGRPFRLSGINHDVTERRRIEQALRESETHLRTLFDSMTLGFSLHDVICDDAGKPIDYRFLEVNNSFEVLTGLKRENIIGRRVRDVLPQTEDYWIEQFGQVAITGVTQRFDSFSQEFGKHLEVVCYAPKIGQFAVLTFDITDRLKLQKEVEQREARFLRLIENASEVITIVDASLSVVYQSPSIQRILGYLPADIIGRQFAAMVHPDDASRIGDSIAATLAGSGEPARMEFRIRNLAGAWRDMSAVAMGIADEQQVVINSLDVTDEQMLAAQLRQAQKMEAIGQLSGGIAHDFNNLLTAIKGYGSLVATSGRLNPEDAENVGQILEAADRAARLTQQLLAFSRMQAMSLKHIDLNQAVKNISLLLKRLIGEQVRIELHLSRGTLPLEADVGMVEQILVNLAVNARDAMPTGGVLSIRSRTIDLDEAAAKAMRGARPGSFAVLTVTDTGSGIPADVGPRIFEPFFTTKVVGKGTGLGLPTVLGIVQQHKGWIFLTTAPGQGTRFDLYFPRAANEIVGSRATLAPKTEAPTRGSETLLVVEDDPIVSQFLQNALRSYGYRIHIAADGDSALVVWRQHRPEIRLLLTDIVMPGELDGWSLAMIVLEEDPTLPVIYASGYNSDSAGRLVDPPAGTIMLKKPFNADELAATVRRAIDAAAAAKGRVIS